MNCECFYVVKDNTLENARELAKRIDATANDRGDELYPVCISKVKRDFYATSDYDNFNTDFKVKEGQFLVFVQGKYHSMCSIRPKGGRRGFPNMFEHDDFYSCFDDYIKDIEEV